MGKFFKIFLIKIWVIAVCLPQVSRAADENFRISEMSIFAMAFSDIIPVDEEDALGLYLGGWIGTQGIMVNGRQVMEATVQQFCVGQRNSPEPRIMITGTITSQQGEEVPIQATSYLRDGRLFSDIRTIDGKIAEYAGFLEGNSIIWVPKYFVKTFDWQCDTFAYQKTGIALYSRAVKYVELKDENFSGMINVDMKLTRNDANFPVREIKPFKATFGTPRSKPSMGE